MFAQLKKQNTRQCISLVSRPVPSEGADAIISIRTAQGAIACSLGLVTAPVVAVPAHWVFGRGKFEGYIESRRENQRAIDALAARVSANMDSTVVHVETSSPGWDALRGLSETRLTRGNSAELLVDGVATERCTSRTRRPSAWRQVEPVLELEPERRERPGSRLGRHGCGDRGPGQPHPLHPARRRDRSTPYLPPLRSCRRPP